MKADEKKIERAMQMLAAMTVKYIAEEENDSTEHVFKAFRRSNTFEALFDAETGLWHNGPGYIADEYRLYH